jgi:uncharacterized protein
VFLDPLALTRLDRVEDGEERFQTIGATPVGIVLVAHTIREVSDEDEIIRIISARGATPSERRRYEEVD